LRSMPLRVCCASQGPEKAIPARSGGQETQ
jgi:hypothetical protein